MGRTNFDDTYFFKINIKMRIFYVTNGIKIPFFRVSVAIEPGRSLLQFVTTYRLTRSLIKYLKLLIQEFIQQ